MVGIRLLVPANTHLELQPRPALGFSFGAVRSLSPLHGQHPGRMLQGSPTFGRTLRALPWFEPRGATGSPAAAMCCRAFTYYARSRFGKQAGSSIAEFAHAGRQ
jgi:hypothetical protein